MNEEILAQARAAQSPEELMKIAHENGMPDFNEENAKVYFNALHHSGELADEEIDVSAGGCAVRSRGQKMVSAVNSCKHWRCKHCNPHGESGYLKKKPDYEAEETLWDCHCAPQHEFLAPEFLTYHREHQCYECYYCSYERGAWWCNNAKHYSE